MKKVLITGCAGFLGANLCEHYLKLDWHVVGIDNLIGGYRSNVPKEVEFHELCLGELRAISPFFKGVDLVIHTACTAYEGLSVFSPSLINWNTSQIAVNTMIAALNNDVSKFIHCSSMARYGAIVGNDKYTEDMVCNPCDPYGIAKYSTEKMLANIASTHGISLNIAVPHNIVGPKQKYDDPFRNVASIMINLMLQSRQPIIYGDGLQTRCFSDIEDCIACLVSLSNYTGTTGEIFNIGPDEEPITIIDLAKLIATKLDFDLKPIFKPGRPQEVKHALCSSDKARKLLNYQTTVSLDRSIDKLIDYISELGPKPFEYHLPIEIQSSLIPETWSKQLF